MASSRLSAIISLFALWLLTDAAYSDDWPMWRKDGARSGSASANLPAKRHLQWTRQLSRPHPAWPNEARLHFDVSYEPVIAGARMFIGSMVDGSVVALDCDSGRELWRFYSNGPVRLAPVAFEGHVCFGSDDGWLYCLNASNGQLEWKVSGSPSDRAAYTHLGNARLVSFWPVRGGPVYSDGIIYFGAGIWPTLGVFVHAVDASSGKVIWTNDNSHAIENVRIDHNYLQEAGISPQGHMLIQGDLLIVPNGRSMPARLDRKTGDLQYFVQGYRNGDSRVIVSDDIALVGRTGVVSLKDGREVANRWVEAGEDAPKSWSTPKVDQFEGPLFPYKFLPGCDFRSVIHNQIAYGVEDGVIFAYDMKHPVRSLQKQKFNGKDIQPARWDAPELWSLKTPFAGKKLPSNSLIKSGDQLYGHCGKHLFAVKLSSDTRSAGSLIWTENLRETPGSIVAAHGQLFVATLEGSILGFGELNIQPTVFRRTPNIQKPETDKWTQAADNLLKAVDHRNGYALVAGLTNGRLVSELLYRTDLHVLAIDDNHDLVDKLRRRFGSDDRFTTRFQAIVGHPSKVVLPPYLANLIVSEETRKMHLEVASNRQSFYRSLRPYGGSMCLARDEIPNVDSESWPRSDYPGIDNQLAAGLRIITRTGPLLGSAVWSHETGDAARSFFSRDELVRAPLAVLWYGDGRDHGFHKRKDYGHGLKPQVAGGRLFAFQVATNTLKAVDAYTGRLLWSRKLGGSARYASMRDAVYVADERQCMVLDPATGESTATYVIDVGQAPDTPVSASDIRVGKNTILIAVRFNTVNAINAGRWNSTHIVALNRHTGSQLWSRRATHRYNTAAIALARGRVFCIDSHSPDVISAMARRGEDTKSLSSTLLALDAEDGREIWKIVRDDPPANLTSLHFMGLRTQDDWLAYSTDHDLLVAGKANNTFALDASTGKELWHKPVRGQQPLILGPESFINQTGHTYDIARGDRISDVALFSRGGCNYAVGGKNLLFLRSNCATYVDVQSKKEYAIRNLRSGCSNSLVAADGLLNAPCFSVGCVCNYPIQTSFAMYHLPESGDWHDRKQRDP